MKTYTADTLIVEKSKKYIILAILFFIISSLFGVVLSKYMGELTNGAIYSDYKLLVRGAIIAVISIVTMMIFNSLSTYYNKKFARKNAICLKENLLSKVLNSKKNICSESELMALMVSDIQILHENYYSLIGLIIGNAIKISISLLALYFVNIKIFISFTLISIVPLVIVQITKKHSKNAYNNFSFNSKNYLSYIKEIIFGRKTIMRNNAYENFSLKIKNNEEEFESSRLRKDVTMQVISFFSISVGMIAHIVCMMIAGILIYKGEIKAGAMIYSTQLLNFVFPPLNQIIANLTAVKSTKEIRARYMKVLQEIENDGLLNLITGSIYEIKYDNVMIKYADCNKELHKINYIFEKGKTYAIVGKSGVGKSSMMKILIDDIPYEGKIYVSGRKLSEYSFSSLLDRISYVEQDAFIFKGSFKYNITLGKNKCIDSNILSNIGIDKELLDKEDIGVEGSNLSGGERKRISLARAFANNPEVIIYDEPTANLDQITSAKIEDTIFKTSTNENIVIVITHNTAEDYLSKFDGILNLG